MSKSSFRERGKKTGIEFYGCYRWWDLAEDPCAQVGACVVWTFYQQGEHLDFLTSFPRCGTQWEGLSAIKSYIKKWSQTLPYRAPYKIFFLWITGVAINTDEKDCSVRKFGGEESEFELKCIKFQMSLRFAWEVLNFYNLFFLTKLNCLSIGSLPNLKNIFSVKMNTVS